VVVRLVLPFPHATECWLNMSAQELYPVELVRFPPHAHPNKMQMVWHQATGRAEKLLANSGMEHKLTERGMKIYCKPSERSLLKRVCPENHRVPLIMMFLEPWKVPFFQWRHER